MSEAAGLLFAALSAGDFDLSLEIYNSAYDELLENIDDEYFAPELNHIISMFKKFFDKNYEIEEFKRDNYILTRLATVFSEEDNFRGEYNKVCYLIRQNL